jgi:hypothetical protein
VDFRVEIAGYWTVNGRQGSSRTELAAMGIWPQITQNAAVVVYLAQIAAISASKAVLKTAAAICTEVQQPP